MSGSGKSSTSTSQIAIPQEVMDRYNMVNNMAYGAAQNPFQQYSTDPNAFVAQLNPLDIEKYQNPYVDSVVNSTMDVVQQQQQQAQAGQLGTAVTSGAFGGDRAGIAAANLGQQQDMASAQIASSLYSDSYNQALGVAQQQQQAQQQTDQAGLSALYNQFMQQQAYPFQTAQFLSNIATGTGALSGSTTASTQPYSFFSDRRLKENIRRIGKADNGLPIHSFNYKGDPTPRIGFMADEVEKKHPEAVKTDPHSGYKTVDYDRAARARGGLVPAGYAAGGAPEGPYGAPVGSSPGLGGYVPPAYLPVGELMVADPAFEQQSAQSIIDQINAGAQLGDSIVSLKDTYGELGFGKPEQPVVEVNQPMYRGGLVRRAAGGPVNPVDQGGYLGGVLAQAPQQAQPELMTAQTPGEGQSDFSKTMDIAKTAMMMFGMNRGGRAGYAEGGGSALLEEEEYQPPGGLAPPAPIRPVEMVSEPSVPAYTPAGLGAAAVVPASGDVRITHPSMYADMAGRGLGTPITPADDIRTSANPTVQPDMAGRGQPVPDYVDPSVRRPMVSGQPDIDRIPRDLSYDVTGLHRQPIGGLSPAGGPLPSNPREAGDTISSALMKPKSPPIPGLGTADLNAAGIGVTPTTGGVAPIKDMGEITPAPTPRGTAKIPTYTTPQGQMDPVEFFNNRIIMQESGGSQFNADGSIKTSSAGAIGVAQVMPGTAPYAAKLAGLPFDENRYRTDPDYNRALGQAYFMEQYKNFGGDLGLAAAAYNAGPGAVNRALQKAHDNGGSYLDYLPAETQNYVASTTGSGRIGGGGLAGPSAARSTMGGGEPSGGDPRQGGGIWGNLKDMAIDPNTGKLDKNFLLSVLSGLGTMASSPSRFLGSAVLQGLGGFANTQAGLQKQAADIGLTQAQQTGALAEAGYAQAQTATTDAERWQKSIMNQDGRLFFQPPIGGPPVPLSEVMANPERYGLARSDVPGIQAAAAAASGDPAAAGAGQMVYGVPQSAMASGVAKDNELSNSGQFQTGSEDSLKISNAAQAAATTASEVYPMIVHQAKIVSGLSVPGAASSGAFGEVRATIDNVFNQIARTAGYDTSEWAGLAGEAQVLKKQAIVQGMVQAGTLDAAGAAVLATALETQPSVNNDPRANAELMASLMVMQQRNLDKGRFIQEYAQDQNNPNKFVTYAPQVFADATSQAFAQDQKQLAEVILHGSVLPENWKSAGITTAPMDILTDPRASPQRKMEVLKGFFPEEDPSRLLTYFSRG